MNRECKIKMKMQKKSIQIHNKSRKRGRGGRSVKEAVYFPKIVSFEMEEK